MCFLFSSTADCGHRATKFWAKSKEIIFEDTSDCVALLAINMLLHIFQALNYTNELLISLFSFLSFLLQLHWTDMDDVAYAWDNQNYAMSRNVVRWVIVPIYVYIFVICSHSKTVTTLIPVFEL